MKNLMYVLLLLAFSNPLMGQEKSFEEKAREISDSIEIITETAKEKLKMDIEAIDKQVENGTLTLEEANEQKNILAEKAAQNIDEKVAKQQAKLEALVQEKVDGSIESRTKEEDEDGIIVIRLPKEKTYKKRSVKRTRSGLTFAVGMNNLATEADGLSDFDHKVWGSRFWELGYSWNTRLSKESGLLRARYGFSFLWSNLKPTEDRIFVPEGDQTQLVTSGLPIDRVRFRNFQLIAPLHLEFDFSPKKVDENGNVRFRSQRGFRLGVGGYAGVLINSKQIIVYNEEDIKVREVQRGDFNVSNFTYGLSAYIGYRNTSLYARYDLQPMFQDNPTDDHLVSLGLRFDFL